MLAVLLKALHFERAHFAPLQHVLRQRVHHFLAQTELASEVVAEEGGALAGFGLSTVAARLLLVDLAHQLLAHFFLFRLGGRLASAAGL